jgi:proteasome accessory factor C
VSGASDRLPRLLALVPWLLAHPGSRIADAAREFGVTEKQLDADLKLIWMCGLPGQGGGDLIDVAWSVDGDRVSLSNADTIARPLKLTPEESVALIAVLRTFRDLPALTDTDPVDRALAKLESAAGEAAALAEHVAVAVDVPPAVAPIVGEGLQAGRRLHLRYYVPSRDEATERDVDPIRTLHTGGQTYLEGWCHRADGVRRFRLDRVLSARVLDVAAEPAPAPVDTDLDDGLYRPDPGDPLVVLDLAPSARWVAEYYPVESSDERDDGSLRVGLRVADDRLAARLALRLGGAARIVEPAELADRVRAQAAAARAAYDDDGGAAP